MIHEAPLKVNKQCMANLKKLFRERMKTHYKYVLQNIRIIFNYWGIYFFIMIGLLGSLFFILFVIYEKMDTLCPEEHLIYLSAIFYTITFQFSIKYFFHPADIIHFRQHKAFVLVLRKFAIIHAVYQHLFNWAVILLVVSPIYFYLTENSFAHYFFIYIFSVSFTLATSMIRKEAKYHLREQHKKIYPYMYALTFVAMQIWYTAIFCFADIVYIVVGILVNLIIFLYTYRWGNHIVISTFHYLVDSDSKPNMLTAIVVGLNPKYNSYMKVNKIEPFVIKSTSRLLPGKHYKVYLLETLMKRLLRTSSYVLSKVLLYFVSIIGLFMIDTKFQFTLLAIVTFYVSYLIHKQHVDHFYSKTLMNTYLKQGLDVKFTELKLTAILTIPTIIVLFFAFFFLQMIR